MELGVVKEKGGQEKRRMGGEGRGERKKIYVLLWLLWNNCNCHCTIYFSLLQEVTERKNETLSVSILSLPSLVFLPLAQSSTFL